MSFAILRHAKISSTTKGSAIAHNHRQVQGEQINIDSSLSGLNRLFFGPGAKDRIDEKLPEKMRKDAVVAVELLLTASPEFFDGLEKDRTKLSKHPVFLDWVQRTKKWAEAEFGKNLVDLALHMDESTPHFHALAVPLTKDGRLCAKEITARPEMQRRQTDYARAMDKFGLKRGDPAVETKRRHIGLKESAGSGGKTAQLETRLAKAEAALARQRQLSKEWSDADMAKIHALEAKLATVLLERDSLKTEVGTMEKETKTLADELAASKLKFAAMATAYEAHKAQGLAPRDFMPGEAQDGRQEAFDRQWGACEVREVKNAAYGTLIDVCGQQAVYRIRGLPYLCNYPEGTTPPSLTQQTEQQKGGIGR